MRKKHCSNCGAPITSEICPYCHVKTGLDTKNADMEYPLLECRECHLNFWNLWFPLIFAVSFGFFGFIFPLLFLLSSSESIVEILLFCSIFAIVGVVSFIIVFRNVICYFKVKDKGVEIEATVYGYMDDNIILNGIPAQIVKLLINTDEGLRFILYQLGDTKHPFKINSKIKIIKYEDLFYIPEKY